MIKTEVEFLIEQLERLTLDTDKDLSPLRSYKYRINDVGTFILKQRPDTEGELIGSSSLLDHAEFKLTGSAKSTAREDFTEYRRDFRDVLRTYISYGDKYNLWELPKKDRL